MGSNPGGYVYGTILVATLLTAENAAHESYATTVGSVALTLALYWLAAAYADFAGARASTGEHFTLRGFAGVAGHELALVAGALVPLLVVFACWAAGARLATATSLGAWAAAAIVALTELVLGLRSHLDGPELVVQTGFGILFGVMVVALRVLLH
jgi:hypothetical protein